MIVWRNCSICSITLRLRNPGFSLDVVDNDKGFMCDREILNRKKKDYKNLNGFQAMEL